MTGFRTSTRLALATSFLAGLCLPSAATASTGGAFASEAATIDSVTCRVGCAGLDTARPGSTVRISGEAMDGVATVVFRGGKGLKDDVSAAVAAVTPTAVDVVVPAGARSGRVFVANADGNPSRASRRPLRIDGGASSGGAPRIEARVDSKRVFVDGRSKPTLSYFIGGDAPAAVRVDLVRDGDDVPLRSWAPGELAPGSVDAVEWDGLVGGKRSPDGRYEFRVTATGTGVRSAQTAPTVVSGFVLLSHRFPIAGKHRFGTGAGAFGGGRNHKGLDIFARCGTPLVAARGGTVKFKQFQSRAGYYVVIDGAEEDMDYAYMHLREAALVSKGDRVKTGQLIGYVGDTGRAHGCHLHIELWTGGGWYSGGSPIDPTALLRSWDTTS